MSNKEEHVDGIGLHYVSRMNIVVHPQRPQGVYYRESIVETLFRRPHVQVHVREMEVHLWKGSWLSFGLFWTEIWLLFRLLGIFFMVVLLGILT